MARNREALDAELADLPPELRWREWMGRVVGQGVSLDLLIEDIKVELQGRPFELAAVAGGWMFRTLLRFATAIRTAADVKEQLRHLSELDVAVLAAVAYHQPIDRDELNDIFGGAVSRDLIGRLRQLDLISIGPRSPRPGAPRPTPT